MFIGFFLAQKLTSSQKPCSQSLGGPLEVRRFIPFGIAGGFFVWCSGESFLLSRRMYIPVPPFNGKIFRTLHSDCYHKRKYTVDHLAEEEVLAHAIKANDTEVLISCSLLCHGLQDRGIHTGMHLGILITLDRKPYFAIIS